MNNISYSTLGFEDRDIEAALDAVAAAGFRQVELLGHEPHISAPLSGAAAVAFRRHLQERGFSAWTVHAPLRRNALGAPEETWRSEVITRTSAYLRFAGSIGAVAVIVHPVPNPMFVSDGDDPAVPARIGAAVRRSLDDLAPVAQEAGVIMLLENLPYLCNYPYLTHAELRPLVDGYPAAHVGLVVDAGHAGTNGTDPAEEIRIAGGRLRGTHLHDVDGAAPDDQHWAPGQGALDWDAIRAALLAVGYAGMWTFEVAHGRHNESREELAHMTYQWALRW